MSLLLLIGGEVDCFGADGGLSDNLPLCQAVREGETRWATSGGGVLLTPEELAWLQSHPVITVTSDSNTPPYFFKDSAGRHTGIICDILEHMGRRLGISFTYTGENYAELIQAVRDGSADVSVLNDPVDAPYEHNYLKTREFLFLPYSLWVRTDDAIAAKGSFHLEGKTLVLTEGWDLRHPFLQRFRGAKLLPLVNVKDCAAAVLNRQADGYIDVYSIVSDLVQRNLLTGLQVEEIYNEGCPAAFFIRKDWPELFSAFEKALGCFSEADLREILIHWKAYLDDPSYRLKALYLTEDERAWLRQGQTIRVGFDPQWPPVEYANESGNMQGVSAEYLTRLGQLTGIVFEPVHTKNWQEVYAKLSSGEIDMVTTLAKTPDREAFLDFTAPYVFLPITIFALDDVAYVGSLQYWKGKRIGVVQNYLEEEILRKGYPEIGIEVFASVPDALHAVSKGQVDAYLGNIAVVNHFIAKNRLYNIKVAGETDYRYDLSMAVRKEHVELVSIVNKALGALPQEEKDEIYQRWVPVRYVPEFDYSLLWKVLAGVLLVVAFILYWNRRLSVKVKQRTAALHETNRELIQEIEERRRAEIALRESEEKYRSLFEAASDAIFLIRDGVFVDCNAAALRMFGCSREDFVGQTPDRFSPPEQAGGRDSFREMQAEMAGALQGEPRFFEWLHRRYDGTVFDAEVNITGLAIDGAPYLLAIVRDISARKAAERALQESEQNYREIFDASSEAIFIHDAATGAILDVNQAALDMFGYSETEIKVASLGELSSAAPGFGQEDALAKMRLSETEGPKLFEWECRHKDGRVFLTEIAFKKTKIGGQGRVLSVMRDITDRKNLEGQFRQAQKMEAVGQLAGGVAHDFNNLLQIINGYGEMVAAELGEDSPVFPDLNEVLAAGKRAGRLVGQLLAFSRRQIIKPEHISLKAVVEDLLKMLQRVIGEHIQLDFAADAHLGLVHADRGQMEQILMNLCVNARDAMPEGGAITIALKNTRLDDSYIMAHLYATPGDYVELSVSDTGCGMSEETQKHIFEPFFTTKAVGRGTGLGLATVYGIIKQHNGTIQVYSEAGLGTCFKIYLPMVQSAAQTEGILKEAAPAGGRETILLAEDDESIRNLAHRILQQAGYTVITASDGREAIERFGENSDRIQLVVIDVVMPKVGGRVVYDDIIKRFPGLPFLFMSGYNPDGVHTGFILDEGIELLPKPFSPNELLRRVRSILDAARK